MSFAPIGSRPQVVAWWFFWSLLSLPFTLLCRWRPGNALSVPRTGPILLVANHTSAFDPVWISFWLFRRSSYMASSAIFRLPVLGRILPLTGSFPKAKFVKDRDSMRTLSERYEAGDVVVLFPEGTRTFDGRTREVLPGIGRLVKRLNARVVCARILTGHRFHPRWAKYPRSVPVRVDYDPMRTWPEDATVEQINADISAAIRIDDLEPTKVPYPMGFKMAVGLSDYIWACPGCFTQEGLAERGNTVTCTSCAASWTLDTHNRMNGADPLSVHEAFDRLENHFGDADLAGRGCLLRVKGRKSTVLGEGEAALTDGGLRVGDTLLPLDELRAVSVEVQNRLTFRRDGELLELIPEGQSTLKWGHFLGRRLARLEAESKGQ
jgi:1-acyl-sn-glycerol-3-phosphate acyltransferase